jgi:hypothetical protein
MAEEEDSEWLSSKIKGFTFADDDEVIRLLIYLMHQILPFVTFQFDTSQRGIL